MGIKQEFGRKIKRMRINRGLTQEELAEAIEMSQRTLSGIETGENFVSAETIDKLLSALNTTSEELFATNHLRSEKELMNEINLKLKNISKDMYKLEIVYNVLKGLTKDLLKHCKLFRVFRLRNIFLKI